MKYIFHKKNSISFQQGFELAELPIVTFSQGINKFNFLLDTGANNNIIDKRVLDFIKYEPVNYTSDIMGFEGNKVNVELCTITLSYNDKDYSFFYLICDMSKVFDQVKKDNDVIIHGIIGSKFFHEFHFVLDFESMKMYRKTFRN